MKSSKGRRLVCWRCTLWDLCARSMRVCIFMQMTSDISLLCWECRYITLAWVPGNFHHRVKWSLTINLMKRVALRFIKIDSLLMHKFVPLTDCKSIKEFCGLENFPGGWEINFHLCFNWRQWHKLHHREHHQRIVFKQKWGTLQCT